MENLTRDIVLKLSKQVDCPVKGCANKLSKHYNQDLPEKRGNQFVIDDIECTNGDNEPTNIDAIFKKKGDFVHYKLCHDTGAKSGNRTIPEIEAESSDGKEIIEAFFSIRQSKQNLDLYLRKIEDVLESMEYYFADGIGITTEENDTEPSKSEQELNNELIAYSSAYVAESYSFRKRCMHISKNPQIKYEGLKSLCDNYLNSGDVVTGLRVLSQKVYTLPVKTYATTDGENARVKAKLKLSDISQIPNWSPAFDSDYENGFRQDYFSNAPEVIEIPDIFESHLSDVEKVSDGFTQLVEDSEELSNYLNLKEERYKIYQERGEQSRNRSNK